MHCPPLMGILLFPALASAADNAPDSGSPSLATVVALVLAVGAAYLLAHVFVERMQRRFLFTTGAEYVLLGVLLGPLVAHISVFQDLASFGPLIALSAGWIGLLVGMTVDLRRTIALDGSLRLAVLEGLFVAVPVLIVGRIFLGSQWVGVDSTQAWIAAGALATTAWAGSRSALDVVSGRFATTGPLVDLLRRASLLGDVGATIAFGFIFCLFHVDSTLPALARAPTPVEWAALTVGIGAALGLLFSTFMADDEGENSRFLVLIGIIAFASGAAFFLQLSPLAVNLLLGTVLAATFRKAQAIRTTLATTHGPVRLLLLVMAGVLWSPPPLVAAVVATLGYVALRGFGKAVAGGVAALGSGLRADLFRGLLAQGDVAIAMAVSFKLVYQGPAVDIALTAILVSVVLHELTAPRLLKGLLVDTGALRPDVGGAR